MTMKTRQLKTYGMQKSGSKSIAIQSYLKKQEKHQTDNLTLQLKQLEKEDQKTPKIGRKEIIKNKAEISETEMKETIVKINKTKSWFFEKRNKIDKPLARHIKNKREKNQINKIRNEKGEVKQTMQEYKGLSETIMNNHMAIKWITWKKGTDS